jgi:hypothetical protein
MVSSNKEPVPADERTPEEQPEEPGTLERDAYLKEREILVEREGEASQSLDKALITLSGGAFGLTLLFIDRIAPDPKVLGFLYVAWSGFGLSLVSILFSFLMSQWAFRRAREALDSYYTNEGDGREGNRWNVWTAVLTMLSIVTFVVGVGALAVFAVQNLD